MEWSEWYEISRNAKKKIAKSENKNLVKKKWVKKIERKKKIPPKMKVA